jgi:pimeloyl-ACP methyl ester carboxylesterase
MLLDRLAWRREGRDATVSKQTVEAQILALRDWGVVPQKDRYSTLKQIAQRTLIVHGNHDVVVNPINALILAQHMPKSQLIVLPDASHAAHYQHGREFLKLTALFFSD